ncbi:hypothetical protein tb265_30280 [Gemmatimonadetes bacterium T265]|nr:hypothetical protein tb265_30280 [Gemmatimonadetes bacterium T265]
MPLACTKDVPLPFPESGSGVTVYASPGSRTVHAAEAPSARPDESTPTTETVWRPGPGRGTTLQKCDPPPLQHNVVAVIGCTFGPEST